MLADLGAESCNQIEDKRNRLGGDDGIRKSVQLRVALPELRPNFIEEARKSKRYRVRVSNNTYIATYESLMRP